MIENNEIQNERDEEKKRKEWRAIDNILPAIQKQLNITIKKDKREDRKVYEHEAPDFIFSNGKTTIGLEVTECHPSVLINKRTNAPVRLSFEEKVCKKFLDNTFLHSITETDKVIVIIKSGKYLTPSSSIDEVCNSIEQHLRCWKDNTKCNNNNLVRGINVIKTKGRNLVYFSKTAPRNPINSDNVLLRIKEKVKKLQNYQNTNKAYRSNCRIFQYRCVAIGQIAG